MRAEAEALVVVPFGLEQLVVVRLAVDLAMQGGVVPQTGDRAAKILHEHKP